jgi:hypothetical protein
MGMEATQTLANAGHGHAERALDDLLARAVYDALPREEIDRVLTDGYATALEMEVERIDCTRRLMRLQTGRPADDDEVEQAAYALTEITDRLINLRTRLGDAARLFGRNPLADR